MASSPDNGSGASPLLPRPWRTMVMWLALAALVLMFVQMGRGGGGGAVRDMSYDQLIQAINAEGGPRIESINAQMQGNPYAVVTGKLRVDGEAVGVPKRYRCVVTDSMLEKLVEAADGKPIKIETTEPGLLSVILPWLLWVGVFFLLLYFFFLRQLRGGGSGGILSFGKSRAVRFQRDRNPKTFDDVAGIDEAREEIREIVEFLRSPEKFQRLGGRLPKGILLVGGPGTGKTLLAKAIAGEADVPFFSISGSDFVEMYVGVGASRVRDLFAEAKANSPCIVFLDEIDAIGRRRANDMPGSGMETAQTLNAILVEMDGFTSGDNVIVLAATNRPDVLDPALLRPGRFDRRVYVDPPDSRGREAILKVHAKGVKLGDDVDFAQVARMTPTFSGADLENLVNEAALIAVMRNLDAVGMACFEEARDKVRFGREKRSRQIDAEERRDTAFHEAGHAMVMRLVPHVIPLHKVTIIPRGRMLGATMQMPEKDEYSMGRKRILGQIMVTLGGRAAEELFLDDITAGAAQDLKQATSYARGMICEWGMSDALGLPFLGHDEASEEGAWFPTRSYSEETARKIDEEVRRILGEAYDEVKKLLHAHADALRLLVEALLEFEVLSRGELDLLFEANALEPLRERRAEERKNAAASREGAEGNADAASTSASTATSSKTPADEALDTPSWTSPSEEPSDEAFAISEDETPSSSVPPPHRPPPPPSRDGAPDESVAQGTGDAGHHDETKS